MNFKDMVQRAVNAKYKAVLKSSTRVRDSDACCAWGHRPSHITLVKIQTQGFNIKESKPEESRLKKLKPAKDKSPVLPRSKITKPGETSHPDKRKRYFRKKRDQKNNTPATGNHANAIEGKKKRNDQGDTRCYNY